MRLRHWAHPWAEPLHLLQFPLACNKGIASSGISLIPLPPPLAAALPLAFALAFVFVLAAGRCIALTLAGLFKCLSRGEDSPVGKPLASTDLGVGGRLASRLASGVSVGVGGKGNSNISPAKLFGAALLDAAPV